MQVSLHYKKLYFFKSKIELKIKYKERVIPDVRLKCSTVIRLYIITTFYNSLSSFYIRFV